MTKQKNTQQLMPSMTYFQEVTYKLKKNKIAIVSMYLLIFICLMTIVGPYLNGHNFAILDENAVNQWPSKSHLFGTDSLGRDLFSRVWIGGRVSMLIGIIGAFVATFIGCVYGGIAGYLGGKVDDVMMRIVEIIGSIPYLVIVILLSLYAGKGLISIIIAITITGWIGTARLIRGQIMQLRNEEFVMASKSLGGKTFWILRKHLLPNTLGILIVSITFAIPSLIFTESFLSFIGLGIQSPNTSWGALASSARNQIFFYPYQLFFPSIMIALVMLGFSLFGDGLRDALDSKLK
jgi:oligopeptide transport system permease protein